MADLTVKIKMIDEMSNALTNLGNTGSDAFTKMEESCGRVNIGMGKAAGSTSKVSSALSECSGNVKGMNGDTRQLTRTLDEQSGKVNVNTAALNQDAKALKIADTNNKALSSSSKLVADMADEQAEKLEISAKIAREKAKIDEEAAQKARKHCESLKEQAKASDEASDSLKEQIKQAEKLAKTAERLSASSERKAKKAEDSANSARKNANALKEQAAAEEKAAKEISQTANAEKKFADTFNKGEKEVRKYTNALKKAADESDNLGKKGDSTISKLGSLIARAGIVIGLKKIADGFLECGRAAAEYESAIAKISTIADTSQLSMGEISGDIMSLSRKSGQSVTGLSEATYQAISASVDTKDSVKFVEQANMLATGGFTEQATAADVLTTAINAYNLEVSDAVKVSDMLITTQNLGKTTVDELAQNMGRVIPLASAYNVELDNLSSAYAIMTKNGIATAESTTYIKSMLNELGDTGSNVAKTLDSETGQSFAELMDEGYSLADVLAVLGDSVNGNTTAFNNLWGSQEAGIGALALFNAGADEFNVTLNDMQDSAGATEKAYAQMTNTTEFAAQRMKNSFENLGIAVGDTLNMAFSNLYDNVADVTDGLSEFIQANPAVVAALGGSVTAVTTAVGVVTALSGAIEAATIVTEAFNLTLSMTQIGAIVAGLAAAGGVIGGLIYAFSDAKDEVEDYNGTLEECAGEIERTNAAYESVCSLYGENSEAVRRLTSDLETLNAQYEKGGGFIADYEQRLNECSDALRNVNAEYEKKSDDISGTAINGAVMVSQLEAMSHKTKLTNDELDLM